VPTSFFSVRLKDAALSATGVLGLSAVLLSARLFCVRDLHQYLPIFSVKKQPATQEQGASNFKETARAACPSNSNVVNWSYAELGKLADASIEMRLVMMMRKRLQCELERHFFSLNERGIALFLVSRLRHHHQASASRYFPLNDPV
jgi:hypothetical protein